VKILNRFLEGFLWGVIVFLPFSTAGVEICLHSALFIWLIKRTVLGAREYKLTRPKKLKSFFSCFRLPPSALNKPIYALAIISLISCFFGSDIKLGLEGVFGKLYSYFFILFLTIEVVIQYRPDSSAQVKIKDNVLYRILGIFLFSMAVIIFNGWFQYITGRDFLRGYLVSDGLKASFKNSNDFAGWIIAILPILICSVFIKFKRINQLLRPVIKFLCIALAMAIIVLLAKIPSRGAWLGFLISLGFVGILGFVYRNKKLRLSVVLTSAILGILLLSGLIFNQAIKGRLSTLKEGFKADAYRQYTWEEALETIMDFPILGTGPNTYISVNSYYQSIRGGDSQYPHNSFLHMAAEVGLLGLGAFLWILWRFFSLGIENSKKHGNVLLLGVMAGLVAFLVQSFFDTNLYSVQLVVLFWFMLGLGVSVIKLNQSMSS